MGKYRVNINNLDCANCAKEVEKNLNKDNRLQNVIVNFAKSTITYEAAEELNITELNKMVKLVEPEASVSKDEIKKPKEYHVWLLVVSTLIGILGVYVKINPIINNILIIVAYILLLYRTFLNACKMLVRSRTVNENALITISCVGAYIIGEPAEGLMVIILYTIGKILEEKAINNSRKSIKSLIDIKQDYANKKVKNGLEKINVEDIKIGDILIIKQGEKIPVDGKVIKGKTILDVSALTGESEAKEIAENDEVLSGSINLGDIIEIEVIKLFQDSTVAKILDLLDEATDKKAKRETYISKITRIYTPVVLLLAIAIAILGPMIMNITKTEGIYRGLTFLVISCPCAIAISVPLSYFTAIGVASRKGILIKGSNYLDALKDINKIVFDKTGTLTEGSFEVANIDIFDDSYTKEEVIDILVKGETLSNHPIAKSILKLTGDEISSNDVENFKEVSGKGISYTLYGKEIKIGNKNICDCDKDAVLHLSIDNKHIASITINDGIKNNAYNAIKDLKSAGIETYMFTGDKKEVAENIGKKLGIDNIVFEMLPTDKYKNYEKIANGNDVIAFVGDGINDAPTLKRAEVGIAMGGLGTEAAIEAADIVLMSDDLSKIPTAIDIAKYTNRIIKQNLGFAVSIKIAILILSSLGLVNMWFAVFADTGLTLLAILNTLKIIKKFQ